MKAAKEKFPLNILVTLVVGVIIGYFIATYVSGTTGGQAYGPTVTRTCSGNVATITISNSQAVDCAQRGLVCSNGGCVRSAAPACTDTDGGINGNVLGSVTFVDANGATVTKTDKCGSVNVLQEYSCNGTSVALTSIGCQQGCMNGVCRP